MKADLGGETAFVGLRFIAGNPRDIAARAAAGSDSGLLGRKHLGVLDLGLSFDQCWRLGDQRAADLAAEMGQPAGFVGECVEDCKVTFAELHSEPVDGLVLLADGGERVPEEALDLVLFAFLGFDADEQGAINHLFSPLLSALPPAGSVAWAAAVSSRLWRRS